MMESTNTTTFGQLIGAHKINIPIIQRDYAQGRAEEQQRRTRFLNVIDEHLTQNKPLDLDFVYGRLDNDTFYPIDGQQRLTTLFLLYWYLAPDLEHRRCLANFKYDTRVSSREFCAHLVALDFPEWNGLSTTIENQSWFSLSFQTDPTVQAMLTMITDIEKTFDGRDRAQLFVRLGIITFQLLDLGAKGFELTDELYVKMNARGKQLTSFENFKASFIQFLGKFDTIITYPHPEDNERELVCSKYFSYQIDKTWTDLFWKFKGAENVIDTKFLNFFHTITQLLFFKNNPDALAEAFPDSEKEYPNVYTSEQEIRFLFDVLDFLSTTNVKQFFDSLFGQESAEAQARHKVRLFWNDNKSETLFELCINSRDTDARNKIMLYCTLSYCLEQKSGDLIGYVAIIRNLLQATRQDNKPKYVTDVRLNEFGSYWRLFRQLISPNAYHALLGNIDNSKSKITDEAIKNERVKAALMSGPEKEYLRSLEELALFGGLIHQLKPDENSSKFKDYFAAIREIWDCNISDRAVIRALVAKGFDGLLTKCGGLGEMRFFGHKGNWDYILTQPQQNDCKIVELLDDYVTRSGPAESRLKEIIDHWCSTNPNDRSWRYYFMKYDSFTSESNYFSWTNGFPIQSLSSYGRSPLLAYHINPYNLEVCRQLNISELGYAVGAVNAPMVFEDGTQMTYTATGWDLGNNSVLSASSSKDMIEIAVEYLKSL